MIPILYRELTDSVPCLRTQKIDEVYSICSFLRSGFEEFQQFSREITEYGFFLLSGFRSS